MRRAALPDTGSSGTDSSASDSILDAASAAITDTLEDANSAASSDSETSSSPESGVLTTEESSDDDSNATDTAAAETESKENEVAARSDDDSATDRARRLSSDGCKGNKCFASTLINWHSNLRSCTKDVKVGIIDTSFDITHPAFKRLKRSSGEFLNGEAPSTHDWHGTAVLSLLAGDPASNTPGLDPGRKLLSRDRLQERRGRQRVDRYDASSPGTGLARRARRALHQHELLGPRDPLFEKAIARMHAKGVVFIAAAGNQGPTAPPSYPAAYPQVIAVTAVNRNAENYRHANRGPYVDLSAPGVEIMTGIARRQAGLPHGNVFCGSVRHGDYRDPQRSRSRSAHLDKVELLDVSISRI